MTKDSVAGMTGRASIFSTNRQGFALMAVLAVLAVAAILAGVLGPLIYRQLMTARQEATLTEMTALKESLVSFLADTGRFPTEAEGLAALAVDPGVPGWQGPYLVGDRYAPAGELTTDAFGQDYAYDLDPVTTPPGQAALLLASAGLDGAFNAGTLNGTWSAATGGDDILVLVNTDLTDRDKANQARQELQDLAGAAQKYFEDHAAFPAALTDLENLYLDSGIAGDALRDPWRGSYLVEVDNAAQPPVMVLRSCGPDRSDDGGANDDLTLGVDSVVPGRRTTHHMIAIIQAALDSRPALTLTGDWNTDRAALNLAPAFALDGWGQPYAVAVSQRRVLSAGPDGDALTPADNIPTGVVPLGPTP